MTAPLPDDAHPEVTSEHPAGQTAREPQPPAWRRWLPRRRAPEDETAETAGPDPAPDLGADERADEEMPRPEPAVRLRRRRRRLLGAREMAVYHLGGLAFELYRRDALGSEVMRRRAADVAAIDRDVRAIDVVLERAEYRRRSRRRPRPGDEVGACLDCRTPFGPEARFCWRCGVRLAPGEGEDQVTEVISTPHEP